MARIATLSPANPRRKNNGIPIQLNNCNDSRESVIEMSFTVATYYIPYHLRDVCKQDSLRGLPKSYLIPPAQPSEICSNLAKLCTDMERENSNFFQNVPKQMNLKPENAKSIFMSLSKRVVCHDGINWGRIISLYTLAGMFAVHFVNKGQSHVVPKIPHWIKDVIEEHLADWIIQQGGWESLSKRYGGSNGSWSSVFTVGFFAAAGLFLMFRK